MIEGSSFYNRLATREGFNSSVRHINATLELFDSCSTKNNIADELNKLLLAKAFLDEGTLPAINMLLVQKSGYVVKSKNIASITQDASAVIKEISLWKAVDLVIGYHHPDLGFIVINPKNPESQPIIEGFRKNELVVIYAGADNKKTDSAKLLNSAIETLFTLLEGNKTKIPTGLASGPYAFIAPKKKVDQKPARKQANSAVRSAKAAVQSTVAPVVAALPSASAPPPATVASTGAKKMSPLISVVVSNELFHNGNVEAWKRIIRSYNAKYPALQVSIYYDGERIVDINTLFKWGKVKHGSCIQFCVSGEDIQDLAKLSRYFRQGASPQFEAFLHGSPDTVMNLF